MNRKVKLVAKYIFKTMVIVIAGVMFSAALLVNLDTYSWFTKTAGKDIRVSAATAADILDIDNIRLVYDDKWPDNPTAVEIRKAPEFEYSPVIFFSAEGEISRYLLQINPVKLESNEFYTIPLMADINVSQYGELSGEGKDVITGTIKIKYLNEYIDESVDIAFTRDYLMSRLTEKIISPDTSMMLASKEQALIKDNSAIQSYKMESSSERYVESIAIKAIASLVEYLQLNSINTGEIDVNMADVSIFKAAYQMSGDQEFLIDIVFPGLRDYIMELMKHAENLETKITERDSIIAGLRQEITAMADRLIGLEEENADLLSKIDALNTQLAAYQTTVPPVLPGAVTPPATMPAGDVTTAPSGGSINPPVSGGASPPPATEDNNLPTTGGDPIVSPADPPAVEEPVVNPPVVEEPVNEYPSEPGEVQTPEAPPATEEPVTEEPADTSEAQEPEEAPAEEAPPQESPSDEGPEGPADTNDNSTPADSDTVDNLIENPVIEMDGEL